LTEVRTEKGQRMRITEDELYGLNKEKNTAVAYVKTEK